MSLGHHANADSIPDGTKSVVKYVIRFILFIWQLPQNLLGLGVLLYYYLRYKKIESIGNGIFLFQKFCSGGVCLGDIIILKSNHNNDFSRKHELGHRRQSKYLGPLYLLIVGLPSACINIAARFSPRVNASYYQYFPENWANRLGGVDQVDDA